MGWLVWLKPLSSKIHETHRQRAGNTIELWFSIVCNDIRNNIKRDVCRKLYENPKVWVKVTRRISTRMRGRERECSIKLWNHRHSAAGENNSTKNVYRQNMFDCIYNQIMETRSAFFISLCSLFALFPMWLYTFMVLMFSKHITVIFEVEKLCYLCTYAVQHYISDILSFFRIRWSPHFSLVQLKCVLVS